MNSRAITRAVARAPYDCYKHIVVPRCTMLGWEADMLVMHRSGWLEEIEIKVDASDFRAEFRDPSPTKRRKHIALQSSVKGSSMVKRFWFAMPYDLAVRLEPEVPACYGLMGVHEPASKRHKAKATVIRSAPILTAGRKLTIEEQFKLMRLAYIRFWNIEVQER